MALTADRNTPATEIERAISIKVAASTKIYVGALCAVNASGYLVPASNTAGLRVVGVSDEYVDNSAGSNGDKECRIRKGSHGMKNDATNPVAQAGIQRICYVVDDQTVAAEASGGQVVAGIVDKIGDDGLVYVRIPDELDATAALVGASFGDIETVTSGALSLYKRTSLISITGTQAYTLADGLYEGQRKSVIVTVAATSPDGTLTPATFADGTSIDLDAVGESVELEWHATGGWRVISIVGATITA